MIALFRQPVTVKNGADYRQTPQILRKALIQLFLSLL